MVPTERWRFKLNCGHWAKTIDATTAEHFRSTGKGRCDKCAADAGFVDQRRLSDQAKLP